MSADQTEWKVGTAWGLSPTDPLVHDLSIRATGCDFETIAARLDRLERAANDRNFLCLGADAGTAEFAPAREGVSTAAVDAIEPAEVGPYMIVRLLGTGGFSRVFEAYHRNHPEVRVAIKLFQHRWLDALERLEIEKLVLQELNHPNLVRALSSGVTVDGMSYLVMSLVEGARIDEYTRSKGLVFQDIARLFAQLAEAMSCAHDQAVIHRDLKPGNILVTDDGVPVIADFGLAKRLQGERGQSVTASGALVGTLGFLAPEQVGSVKVEVTRSVDIYGLGATLYAVLTGKSPTASENLLVGLNQLQNQRPVPPRSLNPALPIDLQLVCLKCLEKDPRDRYRSMEELARDLRRFEAGQRVVARPPSMWTQLAQWAAGNRTVAGLTGGIFLVVMIGLAAALFLWQRAEAGRVQADRLLQSANSILGKANRLAENSLAQTPGSLEYRYNRLQQSIGFLQDLSEEFPNDFELQRELATTYFRIAKICGRRGNLSEGINWYFAAERLFVELAKQRPDDLTLQFDIFHSLLGRHHLRDTMAEPGYADEELLRAHNLIRVILAADPDNVAYRDAYICTLLLIPGQIYPHDLETSLEMHRLAHAEAMRLREDLPIPCLQWRYAGLTAVSVGGALRSLGRAEEALEWIEKGLELQAEFIEQGSRDPLEKLDWIGLKYEEIEVLLELNELERAKASYKEISDLTAQWVREYPDYFDFTRYREDVLKYGLDHPELDGLRLDKLNQSAK